MAFHQPVGLMEQDRAEPQRGAANSEDITDIYLQLRCKARIEPDLANPWPLVNGTLHRHRSGADLQIALQGVGVVN